MHIARYFLISGKVQGVGYRYFAMRAANQYQISGYARNLTSGQVEVVAEGQREAIEGFKKELAAGPYHAQVVQIEEKVLEISGKFQGFRIEY
ncbi:MAG: acylphosphatase [Acidobacteria bacterium]|nr:acylphosphatase [Acidobacteriota bacterium]